MTSILPVTRVADLQPGDVVSVSLTLHPGVAVTGPITDDHGTLRCGLVVLRHPSGAEGALLDTLTLVSRAPRPLYVNHPRTEPVPGDCARDEEADGYRLIFRVKPYVRRDPYWLDQEGVERTYEHIPDRRLRLLVDGKTGTVVQ